MAFAGFTRRLQRHGAWLERLAIKGDATTPVYAPLIIAPTSAPTKLQAGSIYVDSSGVLQVYNGTASVPGGGGNVVQTFIITSAADTHIFNADRAYQLVSFEVKYGTAAGGALTIDLKKCTGTTAPASGTSMITAALNLNTTINTLQSATLSATPANTVLADGDSAAFDFSAAIQSLAGCAATVIWRPI